jgi:hypothetical protein
MFNNKLFYFGATIALCGGLISCAVDACSFDSDYKKANSQACMLPAIIDTGLSVIPKRLSRINGGTLSIRDAKNPGAEVFLAKSGKSVSIGHLNNEGELQRTLKSSELTSFSLGEIELVLPNASTPRSPLKLRINVEPQLSTDKAGANYATKSTEYDLSTKTPGKPVMIGITSSQKIQLISQTVQGENIYTTQVSSTYAAVPNLVLINTEMQSDLFEKTSPDKYVGFSQSKSGFLYAGKNIAGSDNVSDLIYYSISGTNIIKNGPTQVSLKDLSFLCSDINGKITGVIADGILKFFEGQSFSKVIPTNHGTNENASIATLKFGIGDLDGDQYPDVAIWHNLTNTISVYTLKGEILEWSPELSKKLQAKSASVLGQNFPSAVRLADIDRDGVDDIILADGERLIILPNDGTGDYEKSIVINAIGSGANALGPISAIAIGQLGGNPKSLPSLALVSSQAKKIAVVLNQSTE